MNITKSSLATVAKTKSHCGTRSVSNSLINDGSCDNLQFISTNAAITDNTEVTDNSSSSRTTHNRQDSVEPSRTTEATANSLLNMIVRLARASVNLNVLSNDKSSELKKNGTILSLY